MHCFAKFTGMKNLTLFLILFLTFYYINAQDLTGCTDSYTFEQTTYLDGSNNEIDLVLIEFEDIPDRNNLSGWEFRNTNLRDRNDNPFPTPFSGDGFLYYAGSNFFRDGGNNVIEYNIEIKDPGTYRFIYASAIGIFATDANPATEHNDAWVKFPDADAFFGYRNDVNTITIPNNEGVNQTNPDPNDPILESAYPGATYKVAVNSTRRDNGYFKVYMNQLDDWWYEGANSDEDAHRVYARFDKPGTYTMQISGRSNGFAIDRAVLYKEEGEFANLSNRGDRKNAFKDLSSASPICIGNPSDLSGSKSSSTSVTLTWEDNTVSETGFIVEASTQADFSSVLDTKTVNADATTTVFEGLEEGSTYFFRVKATFSSSNDSGYSEIIEVKTNIKPTLSGPIELEVNGDAFLEFPKQLFTQSFSDADGENIERIRVTSLPDGIQDFQVVNVEDPIVLNSEFNADEIETNNGDVRFRYRASDDFTGKTSFTFTASDGFDFAEQDQTINITVLKPQIQISRNGEVIANQQNINFGQIPFSESSTETFVITNTGNADLTLTALPLVITNTNADEYAIEQQPSQAVLAPGESTELIVAFKPTSVGEKNNAQIVISNNDFDTDDKDFRIDLFGEGTYIGTPPELISAASVSVPENVTATAYTAAASESVTYLLGDSRDEDLFTISEGVDNTQALISFANAPDYENPLDADQDNVYEVELIFTDADDNTVTQVILITVTDISDEIPPLITSGTSATILENTEGVIYKANANEPVTFSLGNEKDEAFFNLENDELSFKEAPDFESPLDTNLDNIYLIDLIARDASLNTTTVEVSIRVTDKPNEGPPSITSAVSLAVLENTTGIIYTANASEPVTFSLGTDKDEAFFSLEDGALSFKEAPDFENPLDAGNDNIYLLDLIATDQDGNATTKEITITITDDTIDNAPEFTSAATLTIEENTTGTIYTAVANEAVTFSLGEDKDEALFLITSDELSFLDVPDFESPLDDNADNVYVLDLIATDADGNITTLELKITITDVSENGGTEPVFTSDSEISVQENILDAFYTVETDVSATYSLGTGNDEGFFSLTDGVLSFNVAPDYENPQDDGQDNIYVVELIAEDTSGNTNSLLLNITVLDEAEEVLSVSDVEDEISIYPNPVSKSLFIDISDMVEVRLLDSRGVTIVRSPTTNVLNVEGVPAGNYFLMIMTNDFTLTKKIIIIK